MINGIGKMAPEDDSDAELTDVIRMVLEKDPFVDVSQVTLRSQNTTVQLFGIVPTESEYDRAESDAWYVIDVDDVENHTKVRA